MQGRGIFNRSLTCTVFNSRIRPPAIGQAPKALIAPHAGDVYSGPIAASAYAQLIPARDIFKRVALLGPSHHVPVDGLTAPSAEAFATPLGLVPVDAQANQKLGSLPQVRVLDQAHADEHSLEVQLPFLQIVFSDFTVVPLAVGDASAEQISQVLDVLWDGPETRFVISSDLSHYYDANTARQLDRSTAAAIEALESESIGKEQACGRIPIRGLRSRTADLRHSGDTGGPRDQVVGYGAFVFGDI